MAKKVKNFKKTNRSNYRNKSTTRYQLPPGTEFDYKDLSLIQKFVNDRGKIVPRRITGITSKEQRNLTSAIKKARFLALLPSGRVRK